MSLKVLPLHPAQHDIYMDQLINLESPCYNIGCYVKLRGPLDREKFLNIVRSLPQVFDAYKMRFDLDDAIPVMYMNTSFQTLPVTETAYHNTTQESVLHWMQAQMKIPFVIKKEIVLCEHYLLQLSADEHWYFFKYHHLITDGYGLAAMTQYVASQYRADGAQTLLPSYETEILKALDYRDTPAYTQEGDYWKNKITHAPGPILEKKYLLGSHRPKEAGTVIVDLSHKQLLQLQALQAQTKSGLQQLTIAALLIYYTRLTGQPELTVGTPLHRRSSRANASVVGLFTGILPFKGSCVPGTTVEALLKNIAATRRQDYRYPHYQLGDLARHLKLSNTGEQLIPIIVNHLNAAFEMQMGPDFQSETYDLPSGDITTPIEILWRDYGQQQPLQLRVDFQLQYFTRTDVELLMQRLLFILEQFETGINDAVETINIIPTAEYKMLMDFNTTPAASSPCTTILERFSEQVWDTPNAIAVQYGNTCLTYRELEQRSNQLAHYLQTQGVKEETLVPLIISRSVNMIVGIWAILKAGGAYVPVDPAWPASRITFILENTNAAVIISDTDLKHPNATVININKVWAHIETLPSKAPQTILTGDNLAYIIYTSGTTGKPKGVTIMHKGLLASTHARQLMYAGTGTALLIPSFTFDSSVAVIFGTLCSGGKLIVCEEDQLKDATVVKELLQQTDIILCVPSYYQFLVDEDLLSDHLKTVILAGESLGSTLVQKHFSRTQHAALYNEYGPTECTVWATVAEIAPNDTLVTIGRPVNAVKVYILDEQQRMLPVGSKGELYIGGEQVARGYLHLPELTAEKFIADFISGDANARLYKSGDTGRWLPDGRIEYLGRIDDQVKIRGYRIEPGEIEQVLQQCEGVTQAVVIALPDGNNRTRLVGYLVTTPVFDKARTLIHLQEKLPEYMVPALLIPLPKFPLSGNGKVDKKALPLPDLHAFTANEYEAPVTTEARLLAGVWEELLGLQRVGLHDNFFALGGDSIISMQVVSRVKHAGYALQTRDIFAQQTIGQLSELLITRSGAAIAGEQGVLIGPAGLLPIQEWYFAEGGDEHTLLNQYVLLDIEKHIAPGFLAACITQLSSYHDSLRFRYQRIADGWLQTYGTAYTELQTMHPEDANADTIHRVVLQEQQQLNIITGQLVRAVLLQSPHSEVKNKLLIMVHHLAIDGVSWRILLGDLAALLAGKSLPVAKTSSYRQWRQALETYAQPSELTYWENIINTPFSLHTDTSFADPIIKAKIREQVNELDPTLTKQLLKDSSRAYNTEINDLLLCGLAQTLSEWNGTDYIRLSAESHGREEIFPGIALDHTVGWFTSQYPLLLNVHHANDIGYQLREIKEQLRQVPGKGLGYGVLKYIAKTPSLAGAEPWEISFNYLGQIDSLATQDGSPFTFLGLHASAAEHSPLEEEIAIDCWVQHGTLKIQWRYSGMHFTAESIATLSGAYIKNLESLITHCVTQTGTPSKTPADYGLQGIITHAALDDFMQAQNRQSQITDLYRLTGLQAGMLFHSLYDEHPGAYIEQFSCELPSVQPALFKQCWEALLKQHSIFRTGFYHEAFDVPLQAVYQNPELPFSVLDYAHLDHAAQQEVINAFVKADLEAGFNLEAPPLMRICLIRLQEDRYRMQWTYHHLLMDGWSLPIVLQELMQHYALLLSGNEIKTNDPDQFGDYIRFLEARDKTLETRYWKDYLQEVEQGSRLPFVAQTSEYVYKEERLHLDATQLAGIERFAKEQHITVNTLIQGVYAYLLYRYTGHQQVLYGITVAGRPDAITHSEKRVGMYINTLPLLATIDEEKSITTWLAELQETQWQSREYQYASLADIQQWSGVPGELFDTILVFENYPGSSTLTGGNNVLPFENLQVQERTNYPLSIKVMLSDGLHIDFGYNEPAVETAYVQAMAGHFRHVLLQIVRHAAQYIKELEILTTPERRKFLYDFNNTVAAYPREENIVSLFRKQAASTPFATAVVFEEELLTYKMLDDRSNAIAHHLQLQGVVPGMRVAAGMIRCIHLLPALLGILKTGAAYVPVDMDYPAERILRMLDDCDAPVMITLSDYTERLHEIGNNKPVYCVDEVAEVQGTTITQVDISPESLAYVMYTSGSTGKPKGAMITHRNVVSLAINPGYAIHRATDAVLSAGSLSFDAVTLEYWGTLLNGSCLVLSGSASFLDTQVLKQLIRRRDVNRSFFTTTWFNQLVDTDIDVFEGLTEVLTGGEKISERHIKAFMKRWPHITIMNAYGPTENTTFSLEFHISWEDCAGNIPIGKPLNNRTAYVLDLAGRPLPAGVTGELYVGGAGIGKGYLNNEELTRERFIQNPFSHIDGDYLYKTGDLVYMRPDGNIVYAGRADDQVKIRGYRIEPGEIVAALKACEGVNMATVLPHRSKNGDLQLIAYFVPEGNANADGIMQSLKQKLPVYMLPSMLISIDQMPLTMNGKVDKKALPTPDLTLNENTYIAPTNDLELQLVNIWKELLGIVRIGIHDNFFSLGGHSLLAMRLQAMVRNRMHTSIGVRAVFTYPTIAQLAIEIGKTNTGKSLPAVAARETWDETPLSFGQERLHFIDKSEGSIQYHIPTVLRIKGSLQIAALEYALRQVINRHTILRTVIHTKDENAYQVIMEEGRWKLDVTNEKGDLQQQILSLINAPFDLATNYMLRATLIRLSKTEHVLVMVLHHIASDGWSAGILSKEAASFYNAFVTDKIAPAPVLSLQYADYAVWQRRYLSDTLLTTQMNYWKNKLQGVPALQLPVDHARPAVRSNHGAISVFHLDTSLLNALKVLSRAENTTLFMTMLAAYNVLLYRFTGQDDLCIGTPVSGRTQQETERLIGFFVNTLALRSDLSDDPAFLTFLQQVRETCLGAYEHQDVPFEKIVEAVAKERDPARSPLFQVMFALRNVHDTPLPQLTGVSVSDEPVAYNTAQFELTLSLEEHEQGITGYVQYNTDLFSEDTISRLSTQFQQLLQAIVSTPAQRVSQLSLLGNEERSHVLGFNNITAPYENNSSIVQLFATQAHQTPHDTAVIFEDTTLTYQELDLRSGQLAQLLISKGVEQEALVAVCMERSLEMIIAILGILKAGAAYVPIDPNYPEERIQYMLSDCNAKITITMEAYQSRIHEARPESDIICMNDDFLLNAMLPVTKETSADQLAYVIYTSGSTGKPKGVMVTHRSVVSLVKDVDYVSLKASDKILSAGSPSFDAVIFEYWGMLLNGGQLVLCSEKTLLNYELLKQEIQKHQITTMFFTTSWFNHLVDADISMFAGMGTVLTGGEKMSETHVARLKRRYPEMRLINIYGPTENTTFSLYYLIPENTVHTPTPIGRPLNNREAYITDTAGNLCPVGIVGEICLGGAGVARGYLHQPALTAAKFVPDNFSKMPGAKLYKTGDLGRWLPDGNIEFTGRKDDQVKIRGYRIETGEIENVLQQHVTIKQAFVMARALAGGQQSDLQLIAYVATTPDFDKTAILVYLKSKLPDYMVPALLVEMESLPLTANGKLNKQALPEPDVAALLIKQYVAPRNATEVALVNIWQLLLKVERVGIHDNFFELGGHSLLVTRVISAIRKTLMIEATIRGLFANPTVAQLAVHLEDLDQAPLLPPVKAMERRDKLPLAFPQERLWFLDRMHGSVNYHIPFALRLQGKLDQQALATALKNIVVQHEVLRTVFTAENGTPFQQIIPADNWQLDVSDLEYTGDDTLAAQLSAIIDTPFDLQTDYMLRAALLPVNETEHLLLIVLHHIAADGWSISVLMRTLMSGYTALLQGISTPLPALPVQYADYALWQRQYVQGAILNKQLAYWKQKLQDVPVLQLPTDLPRPVTQSIRGGTVPYHLDATLTASLQQLSNQEGVTLFMTLLTAFNVLMMRYSGQDDICIGSPIANRTQEEIEALIGFFVNTLALRTDLSGDPDFSTLLSSVKATTLEAYSHQEAPFEKVVETVIHERDLSRSPLFQVMFILQNIPDVPTLELGELQIKEHPIDYLTAKFDLTVDVVATADGLDLRVEYCSDLFYAATIQRMLQHFEILLRAIPSMMNKPLSELPMLTDAESQQLLINFNDTKITYPAGKRVIDLFETQVSLTPDITAIVFENARLTYAGLNAKANQIAHQLQQKAVGADALVAVCMERSINMIAGMLGILKAGAAYVPVDPAYPEARIQYMLSDTDAAVVITDERSHHLLANAGLKDVLVLNEENANSFPSSNPARNAHPDSLTYLIYTSGSTGNPKGVQMQDSALYNLLCWQQQQVNALPAQVLQFTSINFDVSFQEIFSTLCFGNTLHLIDEQRRKDMAYLVEMMNENRISRLFTPYVILKNLAEYSRETNIFPQHLQEYFTAGEALKLSEDVEIFFNTTKAMLQNQYGPSESHVVSAYTVQPGDYRHRVLPPVGKPVSNTQLYILGANKSLSPVGVPGELYIGGTQVSKGYLHLPALTAERFIPDTFHPDMHQRLYKTGDICKWLPDGNIEYLGRGDEQVKIRGNRVEPGEVESVIGQSEWINQCVVLVKEDADKQKRLIAYIVPVGIFDRERLVNYLLTRLPEYMLPSVFMEMPSLPLTNNGKINKRALPEPDLSTGSQKTYLGARNYTEHQLVQIWESLLQVQPVGVNDNFFELGGHSLLAMRLQSAIRKQFQAEVPVKQIFANATIARLAAYLQQAGYEAALPAISTLVRPEKIPLSYSQERMWFIHLLQGSEQYHMPLAIHLEGHLNRSALEQALQEIIQRHEILRTIIVQQNEDASQQVTESDHWRLQIVHVHTEDHSALMADLIKAPFDLTRDPLLRAHLIVFNEMEQILLLNIHHIAADGWSLSVLYKELVALYEGFNSGRKIVLPMPEIQYADYAAWQRTYLNNTMLATSLQYWKQKLTGTPALQLPADRIRPAMQGTAGAVSVFHLDKTLTDQLLSLSQQQDVTLFMTLLSAFNVLLYRYSAQEDICVGSPISGRTLQETESLIGFFINTLALRSDLSGNPSFVTLLQQVKRNTLEAYEHQQVPFEKIVDAVVKERDMSLSPLFQVMFVLQNTPPLPVLRLGDVTLSELPVAHNTAVFDLTCSLKETPTGLDGIIEYSTDLFDETTIQRFIQHFDNLLHAIVQEPLLQIGKLSLLNDIEIQTLSHFNDYTLPVPPQQTFLHFFAAHVAKAPEATAIIFNEITFTYRELDEASNQVAHYLQHAGLGNGTYVPLCMERGTGMLIAMLGIIKAGAAYVPIDPEYPHDRIRYILDDCGADVLLCSEKIQQQLSSLPDLPSLLTWEFIQSAMVQYPSTAPAVAPVPEDIIYVIYTSGSTGKPKGVLIKHSGLLNLVVDQVPMLHLEPGRRMLQFASIGFDASCYEIFTTFGSGSTLVLPNKEDLLTQTGFSALVSKWKIDIALLPPSYLHSVLDMATRLRTIVSCGEPLNREDGKYLQSKGVRLLNAYGPTEITVCATVTDNPIHGEEVVIGKPVANSQLYILDAFNNLCPVGVPGEICISGAGLARGYLNREALTLEKFVPNPFTHAPAVLMYRSGDLGRWRPGGNIEYMGRIDDQVKVRGYRIEPGEIEYELRAAEHVSEAAVVVKGEAGGNRSLVAFVVPDGGFDKAAILTHMKSKLPHYMVPSMLIAIDQLPLMPNGKIDRKVLLEYNTEHEQIHVEEGARDEMEDQLLHIWKEVLQTTQLGIHDNFFEAGGNSLLAIRLIARMQANFQVSIHDLFQHPTVAGISKFAVYEKDYFKNKLRTLAEHYTAPPEHAETELAEKAAWQHQAYLHNMGRLDALDVTEKVAVEKVLLLGATGYLGIHLLHDLLQQHVRVRAIVRADNDADAFARLIRQYEFYFGADPGEALPWLEVHAGDITAPYFGWEENVFENILADCNAIINTAANVKHFGPYVEFEQVNIIPVQTLIDYCSKYPGKVIHHISTTSVAGQRPATATELLFTEGSLDEGQLVSNFYVKSKLAAEKLLDAARAQGVVVNIYRTGNISFHARTGQFQEHIGNSAFYTQIKGFVTLGAVPESSAPLDISNVDQVAASILSIYNKRQLQNRNYHIANPNKLSLNTFVAYLNSYGFDTEVMPVADYLSELIRLYETNKDLINRLLLQADFFQENTEAGNEYLLCTEETNSILDKLHFNWQEIDETQIHLMLQYAESKQFLDMSRNNVRI